jgi:hypothetical protein
MGTPEKAGAGGLIWAQISLAHSMPKYSPETVEAILETIRTTGSARAGRPMSVASILGKSPILINLCWVLLNHGMKIDKLEIPKMF